MDGWRRLGWLAADVININDARSLAAVRFWGPNCGGKDYLKEGREIEIEKLNADRLIGLRELFQQFDLNCLMNR